MKRKPIDLQLNMQHSIEQLHQLEQLKQDNTPYYAHLKRCVDIAHRWSNSHSGSNSNPPSNK